MNRLIAIMLVMFFVGLQSHVAMAKTRDKKEPTPKTEVSDEKTTEKEDKKEDKKGDEESDEKCGSIVVTNKMGEALADGLILIRVAQRRSKPVMKELENGKPDQLPVGQYSSVDYQIQSTKDDKKTILILSGQKFEIEEDKTVEVTLSPPTGLDITVRHRARGDNILLYVTHSVKAENGISLVGIYTGVGEKRPSRVSAPSVQVYTADGETLLSEGKMTFG